MKLVDHYPETLRDIYDKIDEVVIEAEAKPGCMDIALHVVEWIRANWNRRTLIPSWWGPVDPPQEDPETADLPGVQVQVDPLRTHRGRELRDATLAILLTDPNARVSGPCHLATAIAVCVEREWSTSKVYVPQGRAVDRAIRDAQIWRDFSGSSSIDSNIAKYDLSQDRIYVVFRRLQKDKDAREQPILPGL